MPAPAKITVPAVTPGPVPSLSAIKITGLTTGAVAVSAVSTPRTVTLLLARKFMEPPPLAVTVVTSTLPLPAAIMSILARRPEAVTALVEVTLFPALMLITVSTALAVIAKPAIMSLPAVSLIAELLLFAVIAALIFTSFPAVSTIADPVEAAGTVVAVIGKLTITSCVAFSVREFAVVQVSAAATVMSPNCALVPPEPVVTTTLLPPLSAV